MAAAAGLYDPQFEHDACGVGFVADLSGRGGHDVVAKALRVLCNLEHRGAQGGDPGTGDGAGILTQIPDEFFRASCGFELPEAGSYAVGIGFFSSERWLVTPAIERLFRVLDQSASDSASFDECLELLHMGGRSLPHAVLMMIPEPWENHGEMSAERRAFYQFHAALMEPWDGPALIAFTDGSVIGAVLDRNGLRPGRYWVTSDGLVVLASEVGVLDIDPATVIRKGRLQPGRVFLADTVPARPAEDEEVQAARAAEPPYEAWLHAGLIQLADLPDRPDGVADSDDEDLATRQRIHGYTEEELRVILAPMARAGTEPIGSMGTDTPMAVLSRRPRLVFDYFTQLFARVTNPPLDAIREELVTSLGTITGPDRKSEESVV